MNQFLPMTAQELGGRQLDIILVTGDAYVDDPGWGVALIGRWLECHGFSVGVIAQPDWRSPSAFEVLGRPRLFFGVTAGNMDSMVNRMTASRHIRTKDVYSPGGAVGMRPDRATIPYTSMVRSSFPGVPVIIGGIEASLRRMVHYDYWQDKVRGSILLDAKADLLIHGMGELPILEIAQRLKAGKSITECRDIPGVAYALGAKGPVPEGKDVIVAPSLEECKASGPAFNKMTKQMYAESNPHCGRVITQAHGSRHIVINRPAVPLSTAQLDKVNELPFQRLAHPCYRQPIPALQSIQGSITVNRGCSGGCSFCALTIHQGKDVTSRSTESVLREIEGMKRQPGFKGIISDLGGPTANMFHMKCMDERANQLCRRVSCLHPVRCKHYGTDHKPYLDLLRKARNLPGIKRVFVNSGIRYDLAAEDDEFVEELAKFHVAGTLTVAPEHASESVLNKMRKPPITHFKDFMRRFKAANEEAGKTQHVVPYFQAAHPGIGPEETIELALFMRAEGLKPRQVQLFMPTPATLATAMYLTGLDPHGGKEVHVARGGRERSRQRALLLYWKREEAPHVREALRAWDREDLIGKGPECLVAPGPTFGAWTKHHKGKGGQVQASQSEQQQESWEAVACG